MKVAVVTANFGRNCKFSPLPDRETGVDYFYITDQERFKKRSKKFNFIILKDDHHEEIKSDEVCSRSRKLAKRVKMIFWEYISTDYDWIVWVDGTRKIKRKRKNPISLKQYVQTIPRDVDMVLKKHPSRQNVFDEIKICARTGRENPLVAKEWKDYLISEGFTRETNHLLAETNFIFFRSKPNHIPKKFFEEWWTLSSNVLRRDQLTLDYLIWKHGVYKNVLVQDLESKFLLRKGRKTGIGHKECVNWDKLVNKNDFQET